MSANQRGPTAEHSSVVAPEADDPEAGAMGVYEARLGRKVHEVFVKSAAAASLFACCSPPTWELMAPWEREAWMRAGEAAVWEFGEMVKELKLR